MADTLSKRARSVQMSLIRSTNTKPEMIVRRLTHALGGRFRLHKRDLPGTPDLVFSGRHKVIFVHGCFWHRHVGCALARLPKSNLAFWNAKLTANSERDHRQQRKLRRSGWKVLVIWEC